MLHPLLAQRLMITVIGESPEHFPITLSLNPRAWRGRNETVKRTKNPTPRSMRNNAISKALRQISKSPLTRRIDKAKLPHRFTQPKFIIYNGRIDPMEHMSHFN